MKTSKESLMSSSRSSYFLLLTWWLFFCIILIQVFSYSVNGALLSSNCEGGSWCSEMRHTDISFCGTPFFLYHLLMHFNIAITGFTVAVVTSSSSLCFRECIIFLPRAFFFFNVQKNLFWTIEFSCLRTSAIPRKLLRCHLIVPEKWAKKYEIQLTYIQSFNSVVLP